MTVVGRQVKYVACERCREEYAYELERTGLGEAKVYLMLGEEQAEREATEIAHKNLSQRLAIEFDAVPCPSCGHYQAEMCKLLRTEYRDWINALGLLGIAIAMISALCVYVDWVDLSGPDRKFQLWGWSVFSIGILLAAVSFPLRALLASWYDPNSDDLEARLAQARSRAIPRSEYERFLNEHSGQEPSA